MRRLKASRIADTTVTYIILIAVCFILFFPCLWLILGMFPSFMGMIAVYIIMTQFGLINKMWGLILI